MKVHAADRRGHAPFKEAKLWKRTQRPNVRRKGENEQ